MPEEAAWTAVVDRVLAAAPAPTELVWRARTGGLTRFANNGVHQHGEVQQRQYIVRVCRDERFGVVTTGECTAQGVGQAVERAAAAARYGAPAPGGLPAPGNGYATLANAIPTTREISPEARVHAVRPFIETAAARDCTAAGAYATETVGVGVANSHGARAWHEWTDAHFSATITRGDDGSAWVERRAVSASDLGLGAAHDEVFDKAERAAEVESLPPGKYTVLLEPAAVGELLQFLAWLGFGARGFLDGTSFLANRLGERVTGSEVTIVDDCTYPAMPGMPFDFEAVPRTRLSLIEAGVGRGVAHDTTTAAEAGTASTGHALPHPNSVGPFPLHLVMAPGRVPRGDLMRQIDDGILVTRLWYNRVVDPGRTLITGLTRDGTFRIRDGTVGPRVRDFRFNESILSAFSRIVAMSDSLERTERGFVPAVVIEDFTLSSLAGTA